MALKESLFNQVCLHSHQAAEKTFKAVLVYHSKAPPRTHRLVEFVALLGEVEPHLELGELANGLRRLEAYHVPVRYPDALTGSLSENLPGRQEATDALAVAREVSKAVREVIGRSTGAEGPP